MTSFLGRDCQTAASFYRYNGKSNGNYYDGVVLGVGFWGLSRLH